MLSWGKKFLLGVLAMLICAPSWSQNEDLTKLKATFLLEHEAFLCWYGKEQGWDKQLNFDLELNIVNSTGLEILRDLHENPGVWQISCVGPTPFLMGGKDLALQAIALANDSSEATEIMVKSHSPLLAHYGENPLFHTIYGSADTLTGKTFLMRQMAPTFLTLQKFLQIFNLNLTDVKIEHVDTQDLVKTMNAGYGDAMVLWAPFSYEAKYDGYVSVATAKDVDAFIPMLLIAEKQFATEHPELISRFLAFYLHAAEFQRTHLAEMIPAYQHFMQQYAQLPYDELYCQFDLEKHHVFNQAEQLQLLTKDAAESAAGHFNLQNVLDEYRELLSNMPGKKTVKMAAPALREVTSSYLMHLPLWPAMQTDPK